MKKKLMSVAVAAGLTAAGAANAVFVNPDGHGQVLLYPYYTVEGGNDTYINLVNTTDQTKAVKVRFVEAMNSQEVFDFNLYLSPRDHWSAVVYANPNGEGAVVHTGDTSCTVPGGLASKAPGSRGDIVPFRNYEYDVAGESIRGLERTREGYVEIIEMGEVSAETGAALAAAIKHGANGIPANCGLLAERWQAGGIWTSDEQADMTAPGGGLYGYGTIVNVAEGTNATYDAVALDAFTDATIHFRPGSVEPSLANALPYGQVFSSESTAATVVDFDVDPSNPIDAVSAVLMHSSIMNDYVLEPSIGAGTDWVITFPTKRQYVNGSTAVAPFTSIWNGETANACEAITLEYWDREERGVQPDELDYSPQPPAGPAVSLCREANVLTFNQSDVLSPSSRVKRNLDVIHHNGWLEIGFTNATAGVRELAADEVDDGAIVFEGLPTVGFAVQKYVNSSIGGSGVLSNYTGVINHKNARLISEGTPP